MLRAAEAVGCVPAREPAAKGALIWGQEGQDVLLHFCGQLPPLAGFDPFHGYQLMQSPAG